MQESLEKLKLSKPLIRAMQEAGYESATAIQAKTLKRIAGGQDLVALAPDGSGKTTAYVMGVLAQIRYTEDEAPKILVLVPDEVRGGEVVQQFKLLSQRRDLRVMMLSDAVSLDDEIDELSAGTDIVIATPKRARAVYLKLGLNLNKLQMFIADDADELMAKGLQLQVFELARSSGKCQHLFFAQSFHPKLNRIVDEFMNFPAVIEAE
ncbi:DEAD/DEAH box helicase [Pedobacter deserti]|uniref:DEAD/DEAH box helicase n=1 Tax=Pedobacter deserti TaxID=2817382 RepID=UPI00210CD2CB|nr:DEAD/DEAH box helicase [Pedobacter sp. SYSU D00382]